MSLDERSLSDSCDANGSDEVVTLFVRSVNQFASYPTNLVYPHSYDYQLQACREQLDENGEKLFGDENVVGFLEKHEDVAGMFWWRLRQAPFLTIARIQQEESEEYLGTRRDRYLERGAAK